MKSQGVSGGARSWIALLIFGTALSGMAAPKSVSVEATSLSLALRPFSANVAGLGRITNVVTTYDGESDFPMIETVGNLSYFSQELRPRTGVPGVYEADYLTLDANGVVQEYGGFTLNLPSADSDGNGLPDVVQFDRAVNTTVTGSGQADAPPGTFSITGSMSRNANSQAGNYTVLRSTLGLPVTYTGEVHLVRVTGSGSYTRGFQNVLDLTLTQLTSRGHTVTMTGSTTFTTAGGGSSIVLAPFTVTDNVGQRYDVQQTSLTRTGSRFAGPMTLLDGEPTTSWVDYANWILEITDSNDVNNNGLPDISETVILSSPQIMTEPEDAVANLGQAVVFAATITGTEPLSFQWLFDGSILPDQTNATLTLDRVTPRDGGEYRLRVSNPGGQIHSRAARLSVRTPPGHAQWVRQLGQSGESSVRGLVALNDGGCGIAGPLNGAIGFRDQNLSANRDGFVCRLDVAGRIMWIRHLDCTDTLQPNAIAADADGNLYVTGYFVGRALSDGIVSSGGTDVFVIKLNADGSIGWMRTAGGADGYEAGEAIAIDRGNNCLVGGVVGGHGLAQFGAHQIDPEVTDGFVARYDSGGAIQWVQEIGTDGEDGVHALSLGPQDEIRLGGYYSQTLNLGGTTRTNRGGFDALVAQLSSSGSVEWILDFGGSNDDLVRDLARRPSGEVVVGGNFFGTASVGSIGFHSAGDSDGFLVGISPNGHPLWARTFGGSSRDTVQHVEVVGDGLVIAGEMRGTLNLETNALAHGGASDFFVAGLASDRRVEWTFSSGATGTEILKGLTLDPAGNVFLAGYTTSLLDLQGYFAPAVGNQNTAFLGKLRARRVPLTHTRTGSQLQLAWSTLSSGIELLSTTNLSDSFASDPSSITRAGLLHTVMIDPTESSRYFRLRERANVILIQGHSLALQNTNFPAGSMVILESELGLLAPTPNTGAAVNQGMVNFIQNVNYGGSPAQFFIGAEPGITIRPRPLD